LLENSFEKFFGESFWAIQRFHHLLQTPILAQRGNKFYDRNQTLQAEAISDIVRIDLSDWLVLYHFFIMINYICDSM